MKHIPSPTEKYIWIQSLLTYIKDHLHDKNSKDIQTLYSENKLHYYEAEKKRETEQKAKKDIPLPVYIIFIPLVNIICIPFVKGKYTYHIISNSIVSLLALSALFLF